MFKTTQKQDHRSSYHDNLMTGSNELEHHIKFFTPKQHQRHSGRRQLNKYHLDPAITTNQHGRTQIRQCLCIVVSSIISQVEVSTVTTITVTNRRHLHHHSHLSRPYQSPITVMMMLTSKIYEWTPHLPSPTPSSSRALSPFNLTTSISI